MAADDAHGYISNSWQWATLMDDQAQVLVAERGPLVFVFNFSPHNDYEGLKVREGGRWAEAGEGGWGPDSCTLACAALLRPPLPLGRGQGRHAVPGPKLLPAPSPRHPPPTRCRSRSRGGTAWYWTRTRASTGARAAWATTPTTSRSPRGRRRSRARRSTPAGSTSTCWRPPGPWSRTARPQTSRRRRYRRRYRRRCRRRPRRPQPQPQPQQQLLLPQPPLRSGGGRRPTLAPERLAGWARNFQMRESAPAPPLR